MAFVSEQDLYCFMLRGYHIFDECISQQWVKELDEVIDEMNACHFQPSRYPNVRMEPRHDEDEKLIQIVVRNILEVDKIFSDLIDLDFVLPWIVTLLNRSPRLTENYGYFRNANRPAGYHAVRDAGKTQNLNHQGVPQIEMVKVMIPLMEQTPETGTLSFITGSHLLDMKPPFDLNDVDALPELRALNLKAGQPVLFTENLYHSGYPGTNIKKQRRTLFFSYEPSHHADWFVSLSDEFIETCTPRQKKLLRRPGRWHEDWSDELKGIGKGAHSVIFS
jgi:hypothetical protein